jgi:hypothetical protein
MAQPADGRTEAKPWQTLILAVSDRSGRLTARASPLVADPSVSDPELEPVGPATTAQPSMINCRDGRRLVQNVTVRSTIRSDPV